jgi:glycosyltransferase involved in cell wall biosynthesis
MRILLLSDLYPPIIGGLERHVQTLGRSLARRGHEVTVATLWHEGLPEEEVVEGVAIHRVHGLFQRFAGAFEDPARRYAPPVPDPGVVSALRRIVHDTRPDIVHAHNWMVHSYLPLKPLSGARLILSLHDYSLVCAKKSLMFREGVCSGPAPRKCLRCASQHYGGGKGPAIAIANAGMTFIEQSAVDLYVPVSQSVADGNELARRGLRHEVIPNFVPDDVASINAAAHPIRAELPEEYLLFVGALGRHKGIEVVLDAHARLPDAPPLVLLGARWPDTPSTFPPNTLVLQDVPHDAVMAAMAGSLAVLVPSIYPDACPTVAMEAMASGRPVIASRIGGLPDLVADNETGLLVQAGDVDALCSAMGRLIGDPGLRRNMGDAAVEKVRAFTVSAVVERLEAAYARTMVDPGRRAA